MRRSGMLAAILLAAGALVPALAPARASAGERALVVMLVDMSPHGVHTKSGRGKGASAAACVDHLAAAMKGEEVEVHRQDAAALRKQVGAAAKTPFLTWKAAALAAARSQAHADAAVLVDCRPGKKILDVLVAPPAKGVARIQLHGVAPDAPGAAKVVAAAILRRAWLGFVP